MKERLLNIWGNIKLFFLIHHIKMIVATVIFCVIYGFYKYVTVLCDPDKINAWEIRMYVVFGLFMFLFMTFGVLRMFNAVVVNSTYLRTVNRSITTLQTKLDNVSRNVENLERNNNATSNQFRNTITTFETRLTANLRAIVANLKKP